MPPLARGDVVLVPFPFTDLTSAKVRPAVVVSVDPQGEDLVLAFISSVIPREAGPSDLVLREEDPDFVPTGLKRSSVFRMSKVVTVARSLVARRLGRASANLQARLDERLARALGLKHHVD